MLSFGSQILKGLTLVSQFGVIHKNADLMTLTTPNGKRAAALLNTCDNSYTPRTAGMLLDRHFGLQRQSLEPRPHEISFGPFPILDSVP